jgi:ferredoxin
VDRRLRVTVDSKRCIANQMCIHGAPGVFRLDASERSEAYDLAGGSEAEIVDAALSCPVSAIGVFDAETGEDLLD